MKERTKIENKGFGLGYVCGCLLFSGHIGYNERSGNYIVSFKNRNKDAVRVFASFLEEIAGKKPAFEGGSGGGACTVRLYSKDAVKFLKTVCEENVVLKQCQDSAFRAGFLRAVADNKISFRSRVSGKRTRVSMRVFSSRSTRLAIIKDALFMEGISSSIYKTGKQFCLDIEGRSKISAFAEKIGFYEKRKEIKAKRLLEQTVHSEAESGEVYVNST